MSKTNKFQHARFYDDDLGADVLITPRDFDDDKHGGNIECTTTNCHGSLSYVPAYKADGNLADVGEHFKTKGAGQGHEKDCPFNPDPSLQASRRMIEEIEDGKFIVLNINFPTSYNKEKATLAPKKARERMPKIGGSYRPDWKKTNKGNYAPYSGSTAQKLVDHTTMFKEALQQAIEGDKSQLVIASLHGEFPWTRFFAENQNGLRNDSHVVTPVSIFETLHDTLQENEGRFDRFWRPAPVFRRDVKLLPKEDTANRRVLFTHFKNENHQLTNPIQIDGKRFPVQDVIDVENPAIRSEIQAANSFSLVATPYIKTKNVQKILDAGTGKLHVYWPITDRRQLVF